MIDVINLKKDFGEIQVLKGIDITINKGDIVAVLGPFRLRKEYISQMPELYGGSDLWKYYLYGVDIADMRVDINVHRRHMRMVFQHFNLFQNKTVLQNVMMAPAYLKCKDIKKAKRENRKTQFGNLFRGALKKGTDPH